MACSLHNTNRASPGKETDMIYLNCDYNEGAHPKVLQRLVETNAEQSVGYGCDAHCDAARELVRSACEMPEASVHFLVGGTQANTIVIAGALRPHQGALCAVSGHINVHETGSIEATGHKVLGLEGADGKITAAQVRSTVLAHWRDGAFEHTVQPGLVYISFPTELGTLYSKQELTDLYSVCQELDLPLFIDGARLACGLMAPECDLTLAELARLCDVFTMGGTKCGALFGEAVVITNPRLQKDFRYLIKQRGGMLAKGRLLGVQYEALLEDGLYFELGRRTVELALRIKEGLLALGYPYSINSPTNQQFFILPDDVLARLEKDYVLEDNGRVDAHHRCVRICTSWATTPEMAEAFLAAVKAAG